MPESHQGVASGDGKRSKRITIRMSEEERKYINREDRRYGMTIGQFVYALAVAAAEGKIKLEDFLEDWSENKKHAFSNELTLKCL